MTQKNRYSINNENLTVLLYSNDLFHSLVRSIKNELYLNNFNVINNINDIKYLNNPQYISSINIIKISKKRVTVSVFPNGMTSEYQIILTIKSKCFFVNNKDFYPINIQINRTFIEYPGENLSNTIQENEIIEEMYKDAAQKLVNQFLIKLINNY